MVLRTVTLIVGRYRDQSSVSTTGADDSPACFVDVIAVSRSLKVEKFDRCVNGAEV